MNKKLLFEYLLLYPFCYAVAMLVAVFTANIFLEWDAKFALKAFYGLAVVMWFASYVIHYDLLVKTLKSEA